VKIIEVIARLYEIFTVGVTGKSSFEFIPTDKTNKVVENFLLRFEERGIRRESLGLKFMYDYFCNAYNYWYQLDTRFSTIPIDWILGPKMLEKWDTKIEQYQYSYQEGLLKDTSVPDYHEVKAILFPPESRKEIIYSEELEKERFHNTDRGLLHCLLTTSLYSSKSDWCSSCTASDGCKDELKNRDKLLAIERGIIIV
jgi:hypothetical protein